MWKDTINGEQGPRSGVLIAPENCDQLQLALAAGQGRATQRCLLPAQLLELAAEAEARCGDLLLAKAERPGARLVYIVAGPGKSYPRSAEATEIEILRRAKGWHLVHVARSVVYPGQDARCWFRLSDKQKAAARARFEKKLERV